MSTFKIFKLKDSFLQSLPQNWFKKLNELQTVYSTKESCVSVFQGGKYITKKVHREYMSFGVSPEFDESTNKSYMFNNKNNDVPSLLQPLLEMARTIDTRFNNIYVNWYKDGNSYIDPHSDCIAKLEEGSPILIVNFNEGDYNRHFYLKPKSPEDKTLIDIELQNNICLLMDSKWQSNYRHWIDKEDTNQGRVSVSFRVVRTEATKNENQEA